ncbi:hypothetical protein QYF48_16205 [Brevibacillus agri]|nr:hypothetical protein [Brevibacillus agri]MDN4094352.1 hypothetical protein [Brevibacillus agri]
MDNTFKLRKIQLEKRKQLHELLKTKEEQQAKPAKQKGKKADAK